MNRDPIGEEVGRAVRPRLPVVPSNGDATVEVQITEMLVRFHPELMADMGSMYATLATAFGLKNQNGSLYVFNLNDPGNRADPDGECSLSTVVVVIGTATIVIYTFYTWTEHCRELQNRMRNANGDLAECGRVMVDCAEDTMCEVAPDPTFGQGPDQGCCGKIVCEPAWRSFFRRVFDPVRDRLPRRQEIPCNANPQDYMRDLE